MPKKLADRSSKRFWAIIAAFATIYIVWGSTYLFVSFAVDEIPPFRMAGTRFSIAAILMFILIVMTGRLKPVSWQQLKNASLAGIMFLGVGTGGTAWALQYVDSGLTALIISTEPLFIILMMWAIAGKKPDWQSIIGVALGIFGAFLLVVQDEIVVDQSDWFGIGAIFVSILTWGYATILVSRSEMPPNQMLTTGIQLFSGGSILFLVSWLVGEPAISPWALSSKAILSMAFLIVFGSILVFTAFNYLLKQVSPAKVATGTYVNPVIAIFLGWFFAGEVITWQTMIAAVVLLSGVFLINNSDH